MDDRDDHLKNSPFLKPATQGGNGSRVPHASLSGDTAVGAEGKVWGTKMKKLARRFVRDDEGVTAIEYGLIAGLIAAVIVGTVTSIGEKVEAMFQVILAALT